MSKKKDIQQYNLEEHIQYILSAFEKLPKRAMLKVLKEKYIEKIEEILLPKNTIIFSTMFSKKIFSTESTRELIITSHLFLENMIEEIIKKEIPKPKNIIKYSYYNKLIVLHSLSLISDELFKDMKLINEIRNKYAHNLKYSIAEFDIKKFSYLKNFKILDFKRKKDIEKYNHILLSLCIEWTHEKLSKNHECIYLMNY